ncbi:ABC transporter permease [Mucilaginibacter sp. BJC16-A38]|uniref:ABC transporter permease n=1 Tax=Mucilaginibacter phenanthrenivorans TaxID=1234842 RepID=UPI0021576A90|nr:ABC transporter permease [Mucilaginibacter phenanthrenivorans]MCR8557569.1 ABC transporter permease [Mucilaginibacter phenanthrenivorans]
MFKNILLTTRRTLVKNKLYSFVNIGGLTLGIAAYILISAYVNFEKSYDRMFKNADGIYRVESSFYKDRQITDDWPTSTNGYATAMKANFPEIASIVRINWNNSERVVRYNDIKYREEHVCFADTNFFTFFGYPLLQGDPKTVLKDVNTIVISQSAATKYFRNANPMGKFMEVNTLNGSLHCMVTGVFKDVPPNSTMRFNFLISWASTPLFFQDFWYIHESYTFLKLRPGSNIHAVEAKFPALAERFKTGPSMKNLKWAITLVPLTDIHLNPPKQYEIEAKGNRVAVKFLGIIAYVILLIACVNYINLSTAKAIDRSREVGIRKVNGANSMQLLLQFLFESFVVLCISLLMAGLLVLVIDKLLPQLINGNFSFGLLFNSQLYLKIAIVFIGSILISGVYPALLLSKLKPVSVLKGKYSFSKSGVILRKGMVGFQFVASMVLIAGTFAVYRQIIFMTGQQPGTAINQTIVIKAPVNTPNYAQKIQSFKQVMLNSPGIAGVTVSGAVPGKAVGEFLANRRFGASKNDELTYEMLKVDHDFIKNYDLRVVAGRAFDKSRPTDSTGVILNEAAVKQFGFASNEAAVGQQVWIETNEKRPNLVIGVVKNYHQQSLQQKYTAVILFMDPALSWIPTNYYSIKFKGNNTSQVVSAIKNNWNNYFPESSLDWFFLDDFYNRQYLQDVQFGRFFLGFSSLAILIACMGLFGLTAYSTSRRIKEIGVRKVLGASVSNIASVLTLDAVKLVLLSGLLALPIAYIFIQEWRNSYAFKATLTWWQFVLPVIALLFISMATISYLTIRAARANPIKSLRDE